MVHCIHMVVFRIRLNLIAPLSYLISNVERHHVVHIVIPWSTIAVGSLVEQTQH